MFLKILSFLHNLWNCLQGPGHLSNILELNEWLIQQRLTSIGKGK